MIQLLFSTASPLYQPSAQLQIVAQDKRYSFFTFLHHLMMVLGIAAITALALMFIKPELTDRFQAFSPFFKEAEADDADDAATAPAIAGITAASLTAGAASNHATLQTAFNDRDTALMGNSRQQKSVTNWLSKRYRVANEATNMLVSAAYLTAKEIKIDPLLILSVMAIESGLNPFAESPVGAQGLMQVMSKVHQDKFDQMGGVKAALNPVANIRVGAEILKEYVTRGGSVEAGLKLYVGAATQENDGGYGNRVIAEYNRLKDVANGKHVPTTTIAPAAPAPLSTPAMIPVSAPVANTKPAITSSLDNQDEPHHMTAL